MTHLILSIAVAAFAFIMFAIHFYLENRILNTLSYRCPRCDVEIHSETAIPCPECKRPMIIVITEKLF